MTYNFKKIEAKWQKRWAKEKIFEVDINKKKKKYYCLEQFPYPSSSGLHVGHTFIYTIGDVYARFKRMNGFNVLYPMGFDSFGLPAENAAIKEKKHPKKFTEDAIKSFIKQLKSFGNSYDWTRIVETHKPEFYKWDQWIFLKMYEKGLAYRKKAPVNFCKKCNTVLANEQVVNGKCWRHEDTVVQIKHLEQWFLKITDYADELYQSLDTKLKDWPRTIITLQKNWIGKSEGVEIDFEINTKKYPIFTTRIDTIYGVTFMVVSAQHYDLMELVTKNNKKEVERFLKKIKTTKQEDLDKLEKEGVFSGSYAIHPLTKEKIPVWIGNFVVADYGSGIVMGVPAHDQRDFDFAKKYKLPVKFVIKPNDFKNKNFSSKEAFAYYGILINSKEFDGLNSKEAKEHIINFLKDRKLGKKTINFKLKDWLISRQRFWGTPIPIVYCEKCGIQPVKEKDLPVKLPDNIKFTSVKNPLVDYKKFVETKCPKCKGKAKRETDTMDTFVNSSWYFLRYCDSKNNEKIFDSKKTEYWMPIDMYIGGKEHAVMHDIYFRFYTKFLRDLGILNFDEPALRLFNQGFVYGSDGRKMSKSYGNVVLLEDAAKKHGVDSTRLFLMSVASPDKDFIWSDKGVKGSMKLTNKILEFFNKVKFTSSSKKIESKLNKTIREVTENIESFKYNLAIIKIRELFEAFVNENKVSKKDAESFLKIISIFIPHLSEELWEKLGNKKFLSLEKWPKADEKKIDKNLEKQEQLIEKLIEDINHVSRLIKEREKKEIKKVFVYVLPNEKEIFQDESNLIKKRTNLEIEIYAVNDKNKYDPEKKSKKSKPGKPAIFLE